MRILYIGSREMGYACLQFLLRRYGQQIVAVYGIDESLAPKIAGHRPFDDLLRGKTFQGKQVPFHKVQDINAPAVMEQITRYAPDLIVQVAWSQIIKDEILRIPRLGCVGFHSSLLPRYRGGSPVNWGLINGEKEWGVSFFYLKPGVDTGDIIAQKKCAIDYADTCKTLYDKCTQLNIEILEEWLPKIEAGTVVAHAQSAVGATVFKRRKPEEGVVDWNKTTEQLYNWVRALTHPYPGAFTFYEGKKVYLWKAKAARWKETAKIGAEKPGYILKIDGAGVWVKTGDGALILEVVGGSEREEDDQPANEYGFERGRMFSSTDASTE